MSNHNLDKTEDERRQLIKMAGGDEQAFAWVVQQYNPVIYPYLLYWLKQAHVAEEITQDVFMQIWKNREKLPAIDNFPGYLYTIARNRARTALSQQLLAPAEPDKEPADLLNNPHRSLELKELAATLEAAIALLPPRRKEVFLLSRQEGLTYEEIAERLQIARSTVNEHMVAALVFLRYYVRDHAGIVISLLVMLVVC